MRGLELATMRDTITTSTNELKEVLIINTQLNIPLFIK